MFRYENSVFIILNCLLFKTESWINARRSCLYSALGFKLRRTGVGYTVRRRLKWSLCEGRLRHLLFKTDSWKYARRSCLYSSLGFKLRRTGVFANTQYCTTTTLNKVSLGEGWRRAFARAAHVMYKYENSIFIFSYYSRRNLGYMHDVVASTHRSAANYAEWV